jgi:hypothetical protein
VTAGRDPFFEARGIARRGVGQGDTAKIEAKLARLGAQRV